MSSLKTVFGAVGLAALTTYFTQQTTAHKLDAVASCAKPLPACVVSHALTMGMNDTFLLSLIGCVICVVLALFVGRDPALEAAKEAKKRGETVTTVESAPASVL